LWFFCHSAFLSRNYSEKGILDEALVTIFKSPVSFTGEDMVEIACRFAINYAVNALSMLASRWRPDYHRIRGRAPCILSAVEGKSEPGNLGSAGTAHRLYCPGRSGTRFQFIPFNVLEMKSIE